MVHEAQRRAASPATHLPIAVATELAHALSAHLAADLPMLHIKGPSAVRYGLRPAHVSSDADVLVTRDDTEQVLLRLASSGWHERPKSRLGAQLVTHSYSLVHPQWPCDIDLHVSFPGFLQAPGATFEVLWERRARMRLAGREVAIPDLSSAILIQAAHSLRTLSQDPRHGREYAYLVDSVLPRLARAQRFDVLDLAAEIRAVDTLRPFLQLLDLELPPATPARVDPALDAWRERVGSRGSVSSQTLLALRGVGWRAKVRGLAMALWPSESDMVLDHPDLVPGRVALARARVARLARGVAAIRGILRGRRLSRRGVTEAGRMENDVS